MLSALLCSLNQFRNALNYNFLNLAVNLMNCHQDEDDGWENHREHDEDTLVQEEPACLRYPKQLPRQILDATHHSLEPDMVFGWRPKLPSCPLPLTYSNPYVQTLLSYIPSDDRFQIKYLGPRYSNSVQLNQQYEYAWRYRSRYACSIEAVREAVKRVGQAYRSATIDVTAGDLRFQSEFEGGNLDMAVRIKKTEYDLFLRSDTNTRGHTSWYYFKVGNNDQIGDIQFNICNFGKKKNLYASGLKPYCLVTGGEWTQTGSFEVNWVERLCRYGFDGKFSQLQFKYSFKQKNQQVYFAYSIPYTYSRLQNFVTQIKLKSNRYVKAGKLCETLGGLDVPLLTITNAPEGSQNSDDNTIQSEVKRKKIVLVTARIHPGQSHSSHVLEGFIRSLLTEDPYSQSLRSSFIFYIVPMLNPDGVVAGNFRTSFSGKDLNRQYNNLNKYVFPQITALHDLALQLKSSYKSAFQFYFDFHAHSSKKGLFCYGPEHGLGKPYFFRARALAKLLQQKSPLFSYKRSIFTVNEMKKATGRAHMLWKIRVPMAFTFQVSSGLFDSKQARNLALKQSNLSQLGNAVVLAFHRYNQLEIKLPTIKVIAKVDTGIKKRSGVSVKQFRKSLTKKGKTMAIKETSHLRDVSNTHSGKDNNLASLQDIIDESLQSKRYKNPKDNQEYLRLIEEINNEPQEAITDEYEGGSDSESEGEDLKDQQIKKLHKMLENRNEHQKSYSKGSLSWKITHKMEIRRQFQSQQTKDIIHQVEGPKKRVTSKYLQPLRNLPLPPRAKRLPLFQTEKIVLPPKNFALEI